MAWLLRTDSGGGTSKQFAKSFVMLSASQSVSTAISVRAGGGTDANELRILDFNALVLSYFEMRTLLQAGLPVRRVTDDPDDNLKAERALAHRIREARHNARIGAPKRQPLSTVPGAVLAVLPSLPDGLEYRFLGHDLILHDTRANIILDRIRCAIECVELVD